MHYFRRETNLKLQFLPYNRPFFYLTFDNERRTKRIRHSCLISSKPQELKPHEVKSTDMQCILTTNINKCRGKKTTRRKKMPDLRLGNVFQLPSRRISRRWTRSGTNLVIFLEALCAQTNLFWRAMKINNMNTEM